MKAPADGSTNGKFAVRLLSVISVYRRLVLPFVFRRAIAKALFSLRYLLALLAFIFLTEPGRVRFLKCIDRRFGNEYLRKHPWIKKPPARESGGRKE